MPRRQRDGGLVTRAEWERMTPWEQGYALFWQAEQRGSELRGLTCPYAHGTPERAMFVRGEQAAMLDAQDSEG